MWPVPVAYYEQLDSFGAVFLHMTFDSRLVRKSCIKSHCWVAAPEWVGGNKNKNLGKTRSIIQSFHMMNYRHLPTLGHLSSKIIHKGIDCEISTSFQTTTHLFDRVNLKMAVLFLFK